MVVAWLLAAGATASADSPSEPIVLRAGESKLVVVPEVSRVAVGQPTIADVRVLSPGEVLVNGKSEGQTTLLLWPSAGKATERVVKVLGPSPVLSAQEVASLLAEEGLTVREVAGYLVVEGSPSPEGRKRLTRLSGLLGPRLLDLTGEGGESAAGAPGQGETDLTTVEALLRRVGGPGLSLSRQAGRVAVEGRVPREAVRKAVMDLATAYFPQAVDALTVEESACLFSIKARVIEVDRQANQELGLEWPTSLPLGERSAPSGVWVESLSRLEPLLLKLKALEQDGRARVLAQPSLVVRDGAEGLFLAGGQIPVPLEVDGRTTVEWKEYGVRLRVQPVLLPSGRIRLTARPEVSTLDWANGVKLNGGTVPALRSRFAETVIEQKDGETLILAGLSLAEESDHGGRVSGLSDVPLLGALFQANRAARQRTELTILLTTMRLSAGGDPDGRADGGD